LFEGVHPYRLCTLKYKGIRTCSCDPEWVIKEGCDPLKVGGGSCRFFDFGNIIFYYQKMKPSIESLQRRLLGTKQSNTVLDGQPRYLSLAENGIFVVPVKKYTLYTCYEVYS